MEQELLTLRMFFSNRRRRCFSISAIEREACIPAKTLEHFLAGRRSLNGSHVVALVSVLKGFGYISTLFHF